MSKILTGKVIAINKMLKTITVMVESSRLHPLYNKAIKRSKKILAQYDGEIELDKIVKIQGTRPISKRKHFRVT